MARLSKKSNTRSSSSKSRRTSSRIQKNRKLSLGNSKLKRFGFVLLFGLVGAGLLINSFASAAYYAHFSDVTHPFSSSANISFLGSSESDKYLIRTFSKSETGVAWGLGFMFQSKDTRDRKYYTFSSSTESPMVNSEGQIVGSKLYLAGSRSLRLADGTTTYQAVLKTYQLGQLGSDGFPTSVNYQTETVLETGGTGVRFDGLAKLSNGGLVTHWHGQDGSGLGQGLRYSYMRPDGSFQPFIKTSFIVTRSSDTVVMQHPDNGEIYSYTAPDAWGSIGRAKLAIVGNDLTLLEKDAYYTKNGNTDASGKVIETGRYASDPEDPELEILYDETNKEIVLTYQAGFERQWIHAPNRHSGYIVASNIAMLRTAGDGSIRTGLTKERIERVAPYAIDNRGDELWIYADFVDADTHTNQYVVTVYDKDFKFVRQTPVQEAISLDEYTNTRGGEPIYASTGTPTTYLRNLVSGNIINQQVDFLGYPPDNNPPPTDTTPPSTPSLIGSVDAKGARLNWSEATDNVGVASYNLYRNNTLLSKVSATAALTYLDSNVSPGTNYKYSVEAVDSSLNVSARSNIVSLTAPSTPPPDPHPVVSLSGILKDSTTNEPIAGAQVNLTDANAKGKNAKTVLYTTTTDINGLYIVQPIDNGTYDITVYVNSQELGTKTVTISDSAVTVNFSVSTDTTGNKGSKGRNR